MVATILFIQILQVYLAILDDVGQVERKANTAEFSVENTKITVEAEIRIEYSVETGESYEFYPNEIKGVEYIGSYLIIKYQQRQKGLAELKCEISNLDTEIETSKCQASIPNKDTGETFNYFIAYTFKFNKNTRYEFSDHIIVFKIGPDRLSITFQKLLIKFSGYTKKYTWSPPPNYRVYAYGHLTDIISNFEEYGGEIIDENDPDAPSITEEPSKDETVEEDADQTHPEDDKEVEQNKETEENKKAEDNKEGEENKKVEDNENDQEEETANKRSWIIFLPVIIGLSVMAVIIAVLVYFNINRQRKTSMA
ncbi:hypothetical protein RF11_09869 [Thelohanellus kitauei]|uniref:Uncharacterized protein n=1 Tax=Thelohanellus kitauei TaxID=669202 RepID=A0A0C2MY11_THEKT|nr:hypothetical protein RF11_09869 [Thelohanellus kitauei]